MAIEGCINIGSTHYDVVGPGIVPMNIYIHYNRKKKCWALYADAYIPTPCDDYDPKYYPRQFHVEAKERKDLIIVYRKWLDLFQGHLDELKEYLEFDEKHPLYKSYGVRIFPEALSYKTIRCNMTGFKPKLWVKKLTPVAFPPRKAYDTDSGYDLYSPRDAIIYPAMQVRFGVGIAIQLPIDTEAQIRPKSGKTDKRHDVMFGTVDSSYRGEVAIHMRNNSTANWIIKRGDKIAQLVICHLYPTCDIIEKDELDPTDRGKGGFGSTGERYE